MFAEELKIGEVVEIDYLDENWEYDRVEVEVIESVSCDECLLYCCTLDKQSDETVNKLGNCESDKREDGRDIIFRRWVLV